MDPQRPYSITAPITYSVGGQQYVALSADGPGPLRW